MPFFDLTHIINVLSSHSPSSWIWITAALSIIARKNLMVRRASAALLPLLNEGR
jgi:hypothetical protein